MMHQNEKNHGMNNSEIKTDQKINQPDSDFNQKEGNNVKYIMEYNNQEYTIFGKDS